MTGKLTGPVLNQNLFDHTRLHSTVTLPYSEAVEFFMSFTYNAIKGSGEQRAIHDAHAKKLEAEMTAGRYTPTCVGVSLTKRQRDNLVVHDGQFTLEVNGEDPLHLTDGGHRFFALQKILGRLKAEIKVAKTEEEKAGLEKHVKQIMDLPIIAVVYLDGDAQQDFLNLQAGRNVDAAHMLSLRILKDAQPDAKLGFATARLLNNQAESPFNKLIRFDSRGMASLAISTLCAKSPSDLATSLLGLARVGLAHGKAAADMVLAYFVIAAFKAISKEAPELLQEGSILCKPPDGTKGSATMLVGLGTILAYRVLSRGDTIPTAEDLEKLVSCARGTLQGKVSGNFSGPMKRKYMGAFATAMLADLECEKHHGIPVSLLTALSTSTFGVPKLPKAPKAKKPKNGKAKKPQSPKAETSPVTIGEHVSPAATPDEPKNNVMVSASVSPAELSYDADLIEENDDPAPWEELVQVGNHWDEELQA